MLELEHSLKLSSMHPLAAEQHWQQLEEDFSCGILFPGSFFLIPKRNDVTC